MRGLALPHPMRARFKNGRLGGAYVVALAVSLATADPEHAEETFLVAEGRCPRSLGAISRRYRVGLAPLGSERVAWR